jgi:Zn-finger nucleic acid-binding protein
MNCKFCNNDLKRVIFQDHITIHYCPDCNASFNEKNDIDSMVIMISPYMYNLHFNYKNNVVRISKGLYQGPANPTPLTDVIIIPMIKNITPKNAAKKLKLYMTFS